MKTTKETLERQLCYTNGKILYHYIRFLETEYERYAIAPLDSFCAKLDAICGTQSNIDNTSDKEMPPLMPADFAHKEDLMSLEKAFENFSRKIQTEKPILEKDKQDVIACDELLFLDDFSSNPRWNSTWGRTVHK